MPARIGHIIKKKGIKGLIAQGYWRAFHGGYQAYSYKKWQHAKERQDLGEAKQKIGSFALKPLISVIVPVFNVDPGFLNRCIESVRRQVYGNWQLCIYDDASSRADTKECLNQWLSQNDSRIRIEFGRRNRHISLSSNAAIAMAKGSHIAILDHDDELSPFALYEVAKVINRYPEADLIYSDEDKIDAHGKRSSPFFKPDWSPELLLSVNYINHLCVIRKQAGDEAGWFKEGYEGAQDHDLFLRISAAGQVRHIPKVLYHWRTAPGSTAADVKEKSYSGKAGIKAIENFMAARGEPAAVSPGAIATEYQVRFLPRKDALVSIIIPFKDNVGLLKKCVNSILDMSTYANYEIMLISNNSEEGATYDFLDSLTDSRIRVLRQDILFNYSRINNLAAAQANGDFLLFLNNDTEVISPTWIEDMLGYAGRNEIGAVGAKLLFGDGTIQHGGVIVGIGGFADHVFAGGRENSGTAFGRDTWSRNYLAVTAACLMLERKKFAEAGGFDEEFIVCGSDVELCLRLFERGYRNVYLAFVKLFHYEAQTRRAWVHEKDIECSLKHYAPFLQAGDPYYNENLSLAAADGYTFRIP